MQVIIINATAFVHPGIATFQSIDIRVTVNISALTYNVTHYSGALIADMKRRTRITIARISTILIIGSIYLLVYGR